MMRSEPLGPHNHILEQLDKCFARPGLGPVDARIGAHPPIALLAHEHDPMQRWLWSYRPRNSSKIICAIAINKTSRPALPKIAGRL